MSQETLETQTIESLKTAEQTPVPEVKTEEVVPEPVKEDWQQITVEELLEQEARKQELEKIAESDKKLMEEISWKVEEKISEAWKIKDESDELGQSGLDEELLKIKTFADRKVLELETKHTADKKILEATVEQLQTKLMELNTKLIETKTSSIEAKDDLVVHFNYLRQWYETDKENPKWASDLSKFHLKSAAVYNGIDPKDLEQAVELVKKQKEDVKSWFSSWYSSTWWMRESVQQNPYIQNQPKKLNKNLL